jgi:hypothetical protein
MWIVDHLLPQIYCQQIYLATEIYQIQLSIYGSDLIHSTSPPYLFHLVALLISWCMLRHHLRDAPFTFPDALPFLPHRCRCWWQCNPLSPPHSPTPLIGGRHLLSRPPPSPSSSVTTSSVTQQVTEMALSPVPFYSAALLTSPSPLTSAPPRQWPNRRQRWRAWSTALATSSTPSSAGSTVPTTSSTPSPIGCMVPPTLVGPRTGTNQMAHHAVIVPPCQPGP